MKKVITGTALGVVLLASAGSASAMTVAEAREAAANRTVKTRLSQVGSPRAALIRKTLEAKRAKRAQLKTRPTLTKSQILSKRLPAALIRTRKGSIKAAQPNQVRTSLTSSTPRS